MSGTLEAVSNGLAIVKDLVSVLGIAAAGGWAWHRYVVQAERHPHIATRAEINFIGRQQGEWLVEVVAVLENKGKVEHRFNKFGFELAGLEGDVPLVRSQRWNGQVDFPQIVAQGSLMPADPAFFFSLGPGVTGRYSHVTSVPANMRFLMLHCHFVYLNRQGYTHSMETIAKVPADAPE